MLICDVDGTVCESCQVIEDETARLLRACGHEIVFLSGTDYPELKRMLPGFNGYILSNSGAECRYNTAIIYADPPLECSGIQYLVRDFPRAEVIDRGSQITISLIGRFSPLEEKKAFDPDGSIRRPLAERISESLPGLKVRLGGTSSIDIGGIDKREGLQRFLEHRPSNAVYIGDDFKGNDAPLLGFLPCVQVSNPQQFRDFLRWI